MVQVTPKGTTLNTIPGYESGSRCATVDRVWNRYNRSGMLRDCGEMAKSMGNTRVQSGGGGLTEDAAGRRLRIDEIPIGQSIDVPIYDENGATLLSRGQVFRDRHAQLLKQRGILYVWVTEDSEVLGDAREDTETRKVCESIDRKAERRDSLEVRSNGPAVIETVNRRIERSEGEKELIVSVRGHAVEAAEDLLSSIAQQSIVSGMDLRPPVDNAIGAMRDDLNLYMSRAASLTEPDFLLKDPRADHLVNVGSVALAMGMYLGYDRQRLHELGLAGLLHDVGMARVPAEIILQPRPLTEGERLEVQRHPAYGVDLLGRTTCVSQVVLMAVYQTHERIDGSGYPKQRKAFFIHDYAKALAVADVFVALQSPRPHREPLSPYQAARAVVYKASQGELDRRMVRALLCAVGLYPIGSWVQLNSGEIGRVIGLQNPNEAYDRPWVALFYDAHERPLNTKKPVNLLDDPELKVMRPLAADGLQTEELAGF